MAVEESASPTPARPPLARMQAASPARFAGWFQPWVVVVLVGLPLMAAVAERRRDVERWLHRQGAGRKTGRDE